MPIKVSQSFYLLSSLRPRTAFGRLWRDVDNASVRFPPMTLRLRVANRCNPPRGSLCQQVVKRQPCDRMHWPEIAFTPEILFCRDFLRSIAA